MKITGLVLQGGGALGAYQYGALKGFYEINPNFSPEIVTGTSIGAVNGAVMLGGRYGALESLDRLWNALQIPPTPFIPQDWQAKVSKFGNPNMYYINPTLMFSPLTADSIYDISPFRKLLLELIDFDKLNDKKTTKLVIEAVNVESGELKQFSNHDKEGLDIDKIISCVSIPPNFPAMKVENGYYWDGGLYANMPLSPAINFLEKYRPTEAEQKKGIAITEREVIVISLFRKGAVLPTTISEITERVKEIIFESKLKLDYKTFEQMNDTIDLMQEIDQVLDQNSPIRNNETFKKLLDHEKINPPVLLQYEAEGVEGTDNFTPEAMDFRVRQGYRDAINSFKEVVNN